MTKITFIAQFPPPIHGLSKAVDTLYHSNLNKKYDFEPINITSNKKILHTLWKIWKGKSDLYYFTISQTKGGNLRDLLIFFLLRLKQSKCLIHLHGGYYRQLIEKNCSEWQRKLNYKALKYINGAIVLGKSLKTIFRGMIDEEKIFTVPNCIDNQYTLPDKTFHTKLSSIKTCQEIHILYLSNFIPSKGYKEVLVLANIAKKQQSKQIHFHFAGMFFDSKEESFFHEYIKKNGLESYVTYHGVVTGKEKQNLLALCHVFILLTRYPNEGQPISILEAMGNGLAVITTNHAGIPDIVQNQVNGMVVDKENIQLDAIFQYISNLIDNREKLSDISYNNYCAATTLYTEENYIQNMDDVFSKILQQ